jgi:hypothetical protein
MPTLTKKYSPTPMVPWHVESENNSGKVIRAKSNRTEDRSGSLEDAKREYRLKEDSNVILIDISNSSVNCIGLTADDAISFANGLLEMAKYIKG